jgi:hypothetical protein
MVHRLGMVIHVTGNFTFIERYTFLSFLWGDGHETIMYMANLSFTYTAAHGVTGLHRS